MLTHHITRQILDKHWVETLGDLRLLVQEGQLRTTGLPIRLCVWVEREIGRFASDTLQLKEEKITTISSQSGSHETKNRMRGILFRHEYDFDTNGVLYYLGTNALGEDWANPAERKVRCDMRYICALHDMIE